MNSINLEFWVNSSSLHFSLFAVRVFFSAIVIICCSANCICVAVQLKVSPCRLWDNCFSAHWPTCKGVSAAQFSLKYILTWGKTQQDHSCVILALLPGNTPPVFGESKAVLPASDIEGAKLWSLKVAVCRLVSLLNFLCDFFHIFLIILSLIRSLWTLQNRPRLWMCL